MLKGSKLNCTNNNNITFAGKTNFAKIITGMTKADALAPIVALEATVTGGRTIQAYKRGGKEEGRERIIEETTGAIVWLWGVKVLNEIGDKILGRYLKTPGKTFDVGTDKVLRKPFENYMKNGTPKKISANKVAALKGVKVATSILIANLFVGFVVPTINHYITNTIRRDHKAKELVQNQGLQTTELLTENTNNTSDNTTFKGSPVAAMNVFTNAIENTNTGKLLSTDFGVAGGRMYNARTKEERNEIAVRDLSSIYFYMWASGHLANILNLAESGRATRLNPTTANILDDYLKKFIDTKGGVLSAEEFKKFVLGSNPADIKLPEGINFEEGSLSLYEKTLNLFKKDKIEPLKVAKVEDLEKIFKDPKIMERIRDMSSLQPLRCGDAVVTKQQIIDALNVSEMNSSKILKPVFEEFTDGASSDPYRYVSNKKLYKLKAEMERYVNDILKMAKDGKVDKKLIDKMKNKNLTYSGINFVAGFVFAATFLSTIIPKIQYYMTKKRTGVDAFPGTYDFEHHREMIV